MIAQHGGVDENGDIVDEVEEFVLDLRRRLNDAICIEDDDQRDAHLERIAGEIDRIDRIARAALSAAPATASLGKRELGTPSPARLA